MVMMAGEDPEMSTMRVAKKTLERLAQHGAKTDSYEDILNAVLDEIEEKRRPP